MITHASSTDKREMHPGDICTCGHYGYSQHDGCKRLVKRCLVDGCPCENFVFSHTVDASSRHRELPERPRAYAGWIDADEANSHFDTLEARIAHLEASLAKSEEANMRLTDLVRYHRSELHDEGLISEEEYAALVAFANSGQRVARLESYDEHRIRANRAEEAGIRKAVRPAEMT